MRIIFCLFIAIGYFSSCKKNNGLTGCEDTSIKTVSLNSCAEKTAGENYPELCFLELVEDSRCPANAVCVWQGVAIAKFSFEINATQHQLTLATVKFPNRPSTDTTVSGYHIQLLDITPYPGTTSQPAQASLRITH